MPHALLRTSSSSLDDLEVLIAPSDAFLVDTPRNLARNASGAEWIAFTRLSGALGPEDANLWCAATPISASARTQAPLPVGRHDGPGERAPRERLPGAADAELSPAGLPEEHAAAHVGAHEHARLIAARAARRPVTAATPRGAGQVADRNSVV